MVGSDVKLSLSDSQQAKGTVRRSKRFGTPMLTALEEGLALANARDVFWRCSAL